MEQDFKKKNALIDKHIKDCSIGEFSFMIMRCISFVLFFIVVFLLWEKGNQLYIGMLLTIGGFLVAGYYQDKQGKKCLFYKRYKRMIEEDLKDKFRESSEKYIPNGDVYGHPFVNDLDVFGKKSLFALIDRTCTHLGKQKLVSWLMKPLLECEIIAERQVAVKEICKMNDFKDLFRLKGITLSDDVNNSVINFESWMRETASTKEVNAIKLYVFAVCFVNMTICSFVLLNILSPYAVVNSVIFFAILSMKVERKVDIIHERISKGILAMGVYADILEYISEKEFASTLLKTWQNQIGGSGERAVKSLKELSQMGAMLDQRKNLLLHFLFEGVLAWQFIQILRIEVWRKKHSDNFMKWLEVIANFDALVSLCLFADKNDTYCYPSLSNKEGTLKGTDVGNPLMMNAKCVTNNVFFVQNGFFMIVTGSNMAGKSTYLKTIGINYILACIGAPVFASSFIICPSQLMASLKTTDSLSMNESYFFAELKKLNAIIKKLKNGERLFILLDEILKGTNSEDKLKGSDAFIRKLIHFKSNGILATHDVKLGNLQKEFPIQIRNYHFSSKIENHTLKFDYKLKEGIVQEFNATFLMEQMDIF